MNSTFSCFASIFGFIATIISLFAFVLQICRSRLPSNKIRTLDLLLEETETLVKTAKNDCRLKEPFVEEIEHHLSILRARTFALRPSAYGATTLHKDYAEWRKGTSSAIGRTYDSLIELKAQVATSSEEGFADLEMDSDFHATSAATPSLDANQNQNAAPRHYHPFRFLTRILFSRSVKEEDLTTHSVTLDAIPSRVVGDSDVRTAEV
ncbi:hypothetical protein JVU11DRAFT_8160 [Chiua virens]|nr:hypothetical protein JVU11DRAFT_8160 [Chiua virens]